MKTIVFIGTQKSGSSREAIRAAEELGYYTVLLTDRPSFLEKRTEFPDAHLMLLCDLNNIDEIRKTINSLFIKALDIVAIASFVDVHCRTSSLLAEEFGLRHFTTEAIEMMLNKVTSREVLSDTPYAPSFTALTEGSAVEKKEIEKRLPLIMKSPSSTGSKDVLKITSYKEFSRSVKKLREKYPGETILLEEFLDGPQYLVETIVNNGKLNIVAIFQQEITFGERFIVTGYDLLIDPEVNFYNKLKLAVEAIISKHGLKHGPCHLEMRFVKKQWKLIEINPRISGGGMNNLIKAGLGINLVRETLKMLIGQEPNLKPPYIKNVFAQYATVSETGVLEKVTGRNKALKSSGVKEVYIKPKKGALLIPPLSMGNRYAYVIATGNTSQDAKINAKTAISQICFHFLKDTKKDEAPEKEVIEIKESEILREVIEKKEPEISADSVTLEKHLNKFKDSLIESGKSEITAKKYDLSISKYLDWYRSSYRKDCIYLERDRVLEYMEYLQKHKKISEKSINRKLRLIQGFNKFLVSYGVQENLVIKKSDMLKLSTNSKSSGKNLDDFNFWK